MAAWTGVAAVGGAAGLVLGGVIAELLGWRWIFLVNVPAGALALALAPRILPAHRGAGMSRGWTCPAPPPPRAGSPCWSSRSRAPSSTRDSRPRRSRRSAGPSSCSPRSPGANARRRIHCCRRRCSRVRPLLAATLTGALLTAATSGGAVLVSLYLQDELRLSPAAAGLVLLPFSVCAAAGSALAGRLPGSPRASIASGVGLVAAGSALAAAHPATATLAGWGVLCGLGIGVASVAATTLGTSAVGERDAGPPPGC